MPLVKIYAPERTNPPRSFAEISDGVQDALVAHANVPPNSRFYLFIRLERDEIVADPSYGGVTRSKNVIVIEITLNAGPDGRGQEGAVCRNRLAAGENRRQAGRRRDLADRGDEGKLVVRRRPGHLRLTTVRTSEHFARMRRRFGLLWAPA